MPPKKKGLSVEEKRERLLELFYEKKEFFQMKDLERIAPKEKGIISMCVKEITQQLVDDGLVNCEKIGTFSCFWAFPSSASIQRKKKISDLEESIEELKAKINEERTRLELLKSANKETEERTIKSNEVEGLKIEHSKVMKDYEKMGILDENAIEAVVNDCNNSRDNANKWIDNLFAMKKWCLSKFNLDRKSFDEQFGLPPDLDYFE